MDFIQHLKDNINVEKFEHQFIETNFDAAPVKIDAVKENVE
jgi:hypothetical protein